MAAKTLRRQVKAPPKTQKNKKAQKKQFQTFRLIIIRSKTPLIYQEEYKFLVILTLEIWQDVRLTLMTQVESYVTWVETDFHTRQKNTIEPGFTSAWKGTKLGSLWLSSWKVWLCKENSTKWAWGLSIGPHQVQNGEDVLVFVSGSTKVVSVWHLRTSLTAVIQKKTLYFSLGPTPTRFRNL